MKRHFLCTLLTLCLVGILSFSSVALAATVKVTVTTDGNGQVSLDGGPWTDSITLDVEEGETLGGRVQYKPNSGFALKDVTTTAGFDLSAKAISGKGQHVLLLDDLGYVWSVGTNEYKERGEGATTSTSANATFSRVSIYLDENGQKIEQDIKFKAVAAGDINASLGFSILIDTSGSVWVAGNNSYGQLGMASNDKPNSFQKISSSVKFKAADVGYRFTLLLDENGHVWGAGVRDRYSNAKPLRETSFWQIAGIKDVTFQAISAGNDSLLLDTDGNVWAAGPNTSNAIGTLPSKGAFQKLELGGQKFSAIAAGYRYSLLLGTDGSVWVAGANNRGQLGNGSNTNQKSFQKVTLPADMGTVTNVFAGYRHTFLLTEKGEIWAVGSNSFGQLGLGMKTGDDQYLTTYQKVNISGAGKIVDASLGYNISYVVDEYGHVFSAGQNEKGQLGRSTGSRNKTSNTFAPIDQVKGNISFEAMKNQKLTGSVTFTINAAPIAGRITYEANGGEWIKPNPSRDYTDGENVPGPNDCIDGRVYLRRSGYLFTGWTMTGNYPYLTYTANWKAETVTIHYDTDGGKPALYPNVTTAVKTVPILSYIENDPNYPPRKLGHVISTGLWAAYDMNNQRIAQDKGIDQYTTWLQIVPDGYTEITVKPIWTANSYDVYYSPFPDSTTYYKNTVKWDEQALKNVSTPSSPGYTFEYWTYNDKRIDSNATYASLAGENDSKELKPRIKAVFTPKLYTVCFDSDGGSAVADKTNVKWKDAVLDGVVAPVRNGWKFTGWMYEGKEVDESKTYGQLAYNDSVEKITLTAGWEEIITPEQPPKTGDDSRLALWFALLVITGGAFAVILHQKRKQTR